jgi:hypothetical protein
MVRLILVSFQFLHMKMDQNYMIGLNCFDSYRYQSTAGGFRIFYRIKSCKDFSGAKDKEDIYIIIINYWILLI